MIQYTYGGRGGKGEKGKERETERTSAKTPCSPCIFIFQGNSPLAHTVDTTILSSVPAVYVSVVYFKWAMLDLLWDSAVWLWGALGRYCLWCGIPSSDNVFTRRSRVINSHPNDPQLIHNSPPTECVNLDFILTDTNGDIVVPMTHKTSLK